MLQNFQWLGDGVELPALDFEKLQDWIVRVAASHDRIVGDITYIFCNDSKILDVNIEFLNHDYFTDIITFDNSRGKLISGDIFISLDTVASNSELVGSSPENELYRVIIHGILHLCGINDKGPGERAIMEDNENKALAIL